MTELDHTSFGTLMAGLSHRASHRGVFCFQDDSGNYTPPWVFTRMTSMVGTPMPWTISPSPSPSSFYIEIEYGSMDSGKWVSDNPRLHIFKLRNGYLQRSAGGAGADSGGPYWSPVGDKIKVMLVNGVPLSVLSKSLDDQLNNNLRRVFG